MSLIHATAIVDPKAQLAENVELGPYCVIGPNVKIGAGSKIGSHTVIEGHTTIGWRPPTRYEVPRGTNPVADW